MRLELLSDRFGNLALDREHVSQIAGVGLRPQMGVVARIHQLSVNPDFVRDLLNTALENMCDTERLPDVSEVPSSGCLVLRHTGSADHLKIGNFCEVGQDFVLNPVGEKG